jgi:hypothetical protein
LTARADDVDHLLVFTVDESNAPVLTVTWRPPHDADTMRAFLAWQLQTIEQARLAGVRTAYVHDAVDAGMLGAPARRAVAEWRAANPGIDDVMVGNWVVSNNGFASATLIALGWFFPEARTVHVVSTHEEAVRLARAALEAAKAANARGRRPR